jgi:hypothetical protein
MNKQTQTALEIFTDIYGSPKWMTNEKEGQDSKKIIEMWDSELKEYSIDQIKKACYTIIKYRRAMTFPTLSHVIAELHDVEKERNADSECMSVLKYLLEHHDGSDHSLLATQRTMWRLYQYSYLGYDVEKDDGFQ